ncbi:hypothetical protein AJ79_02741 [Helicocarpus griseus UAMH5409]|uniref:C6 finger domain transcription factor nscR n=1 Tax=Helicocarpus griseus UAMH5409 TaxID=1447875 RepID=A0A2B7Y134_9EURO|nr:hypothetical protein AJ79_02741 [Helicocarpus griseus UAMH5409]
MSGSLGQENGSSGEKPRPPVSRRRDKPQLSCALCRRKKLKCDRNRPCENCVKRSQLCVYPAPPSRDGADQRARQTHRSNTRNLQDRIQHLEEIVVSLVNRNGGSLAGQAPSSQDTSEDTAAPSSSEQTEQISDSFGRLTVDGSGTNYVGSSHWQAILDELADVKEHFESSTFSPQKASLFDASRSSEEGVELFLGVNENITREEILNTIPPKPVVDCLVSHFLRSMEIGTLIIHPPTFQKEYDLFWQDPSSTDVLWIGLLFAMMCLASHYYLSAGISEEPTQKAKHDIKLYRKRCTQCLILGNYTKPQPIALQTLLLYCNCESMRCQDIDFGISLLAGIAVRLALRMGYHRDPSHYPHISVFEGEMRRRTWAIVSHLDLVVSFQFGLPRLANEKLTDTAPPRNLLNEDFNENTTELPPSRPVTETTPVSYGMARAKLLRFLGTIVETVDSTGQTSYDTIMKHDNELNEVFKSIPPQFKLTNGTFVEAPSSIFQRIVTELMYNKARCLLHRKYFTLSDESYTYSRRTCLDAAMRILKLQSYLYGGIQQGGQYRSIRWKLSLILRQDFILAAIIVCVDLEQKSKRTRPSLPASTNSDFWRPEDKLQALENAYEAWERGKHGSKDVATAAEALKIVIDKHRKSTRPHLTSENDTLPELTPSSIVPNELTQDQSMNDLNPAPAMPYFPDYQYSQQYMNVPSSSMPGITPLAQFSDQDFDSQQPMELSSDSAFKIFENMASEPLDIDWVKKIFI